MSDDGVVYRALAEPVTYPDGDGLTFEGYAAVFNQRAHIVDHLGEYDEVIAPGAFKRSLAGKQPAFFFQHGKHPVVGPFPLGTIETLREDGHGLFVRARLLDNWLVEPVRDAIANRAITGMSVAMASPPDRAPFTTERGGTRLRTVREARLFELGPVVSPAYAGTEAMVRSVFHGLEQSFPEEVERLDIYARIAISEAREQNAAEHDAAEIPDTSEDPALERTSEDPVDEQVSGTSDLDPAEEQIPLDRRHRMWRFEMQRRGMTVPGE